MNRDGSHGGRILLALVGAVVVGVVAGIAGGALFPGLTDSTIFYGVIGALSGGAGVLILRRTGQL